MRFYGKDCETGLAKIVAHLTNSSPSKKRFSNQPIRFPGSNLDSREITGNVIGSARSKDLTARGRGLSPKSTTRSEAPRRWRARRPLASRVRKRNTQKGNSGFQVFPPFVKRKRARRATGSPPLLALALCTNALYFTTGSPSSKYVVYATAFVYRELYGKISNRKKKCVNNYLN